MKLWRDPKSGIYHARFTVDGKRHKQTTGTKVKGQAEAEAVRIWTEATTRAQGREPVQTVAKTLLLWLAAHSRTASIGHYRNVSTWNPCGLEKVMLDRCTTELVEMARERFAQGRRPATVNGWMRTLNLLGGWAVQRGMIQALPWRVKMERVQKAPRKTIPAGKVKPWLEAADATAQKGHRWQIGTALRLMIGLGLREQEALGARWEWIDWERKSYTVGKAKGFEARVIPVPDWLMTWLLTRKADLGLVIGEQRPAGFTRKAMAGANEEVGTPGISAHRLRGTFATLHSEAGTPIQVIQQMLGHKSPTTTMLYLEAHREKAEEQQAKVAEKMGMV